MIANDLFNQWQLDSDLIDAANVIAQNHIFLEDLMEFDYHKESANQKLTAL